MTFTAAQQQAIDARGNVLVEAGAGTGKTRTLVQRCLERILDPDEPVSVDRMLLVTFTEAAAAEMRQRLRTALSEARETRVFGEPPTTSREPRALPAQSSQWLDEQLALLETAHISTLHGFCLHLVREHFHELALDPQLAILDEADARVLAEDTLSTLLERHYAGNDADSAAVRQLILTQARGQEKTISNLVLQLHRYSQTLADPEGWLTEQVVCFSSVQPSQWEAWLREDIGQWRDAWLESLREVPVENENARRCVHALESLPQQPSLADIAAMIASLLEADGDWAPRKKTAHREPLKKLFEDAAFLRSVVEGVEAGDGRIGLELDWEWARPHMLTLLKLAGEFSREFAQAKRELAAVDFHDLEQFALQLLWDRNEKRPTAIAQRWREQFDLVFVDEYQDINAAQDQIIACLSREGERANRFLVGDVKQSIYRFRLADPRIFRSYSREWRNGDALCRVIAMADNFRSHEGILACVNRVFRALMRSEVGGVAYDSEAELKFGAPDQRGHFAAVSDAPPRVELHLRLTGRDSAGAETEQDGGADDLAERTNVELEARLIARRLNQLHAGRHEIRDEKLERMRPVEWRDMVVLLRSPGTKAASFAREFERAGIPLTAARGGFYATTEVMDLISILMLLDNPQQDVPLLAVLRSPLVGLTANDLATIRLAMKGRYWWALRRWHEANSPERNGAMADRDAAARVDPKLFARVDQFLSRFARWRQLARQGALSYCLEAVLDETHYEDWLLAQERGTQRRANVQRLLQMTREFDPLQRQGLFRFLRHVEAQQDAGIDPEPAAAGDSNSVRLMSIHGSKGLEFPVVVLGQLGATFNFTDLRGDILLDERYGLCPQVSPPESPTSYPSLTHWLARQRQQREMLGEELRLLYVAMTRAAQRLILAGTASRSRVVGQWATAAGWHPGTRDLLSARCYLDWLGPLMSALTESEQWAEQANGVAPLLEWRLYESDEWTAENFTQAQSESAQTGGLPVSGISAEQIARLKQRLDWRYPRGAATVEPAKTSVSAVRRRLAEDGDEEARALWRPAISTKTEAGGLDAAATGIAYHKFMQFVRLSETASATDLKSEAERMVQERIISDRERAAIDLKSVERFWESELGQRIVAHASAVRRELPFTMRIRPGELTELAGVEHALAGELDDEFVVVQGVVDLALLLPEKIVLVDFKTDHVSGDTLRGRVQEYASQLQIYARALSAIHGRPVTERWLHFFSVGESVRV